MGCLNLIYKKIKRKFYKVENSARETINVNKCWRSHWKLQMERNWRDRTHTLQVDQPRFNPMFCLNFWILPGTALEVYKHCFGAPPAPTKLINFRKEEKEEQYHCHNVTSFCSHIYWLLIESYPPKIILALHNNLVFFLKIGDINIANFLNKSKTKIGGYMVLGS